MSTQCYGAPAVLLGNSIVVMGGYEISSAEQYNTATGQWSVFPPMNEANNACAAAVLTGKITVVGRQDRKYNSLSSGEGFDPTTERWSIIPSMHTKCRGYAAAVLNGQLYAIGRYDRNKELSSAKILVVGGYDRNTTHAACELYDPITCQWSNIPSMQTKRYGYAAVEVDETLYVMGGSDGTNKLSSIETLIMQQSSSNNKFFAKIRHTPDETSVHLHQQSLPYKNHQSRRLQECIRESSRAKLYEPTVDDFISAANEGNPLFAIVVTAQLISQALLNEMEEDKVRPIPPKQPSVVHQTLIVSCLDVLDEEVRIEKGSSTTRKHMEVLEIDIFGEPQGGQLKE
eukprot:11694064-Ditylum_brightwellii.AAC.1